MRLDFFFNIFSNTTTLLVFFHLLTACHLSLFIVLHILCTHLKSNLISTDPLSIMIGLFFLIVVVNSTCPLDLRKSLENYGINNVLWAKSVKKNILYRTIETKGTQSISKSLVCKSLAALPTTTLPTTPDLISDYTPTTHSTPVLTVRFRGVEITTYTMTSGMKIYKLVLLSKHNKNIIETSLIWLTLFFDNNFTYKFWMFSWSSYSSDWHRLLHFSRDKKKVGSNVCTY